MLMLWLVALCACLLPHILPHFSLDNYPILCYTVNVKKSPFFDLDFFVNKTSAKREHPTALAPPGVFFFYKAIVPNADTVAELSEDTVSVVINPKADRYPLNSRTAYV